MSSSSSVSTYITSSGSTAISGLASGLDTESIIDKLISADSAKLDKLKQDKQLAEWKQEAYRSIISDINTFTSTYFSVTSSSSLIKQSNYQQYTTSSSDTSAVTASAASAATAGSHTISVSQLATSATLKGSSAISKGIVGSSSPDFTSAAGESFVITVDGAEYTVTIDSSMTDADSLQTAVDTAVGNGKVTIGANNNGALTISAATDSGVQSISIADSSNNGALSDLGFGSSAITSNRINTSRTLKSIASEMSSALTFNTDGEVSFSINGTSFTFDQDDTLSTVISKVNSSSAGVTMKYDTLTDKLMLTSTTKGAGKTLTTSDTDGTFVATLLDSSTAGVDAKVTIDGTSLTRNSNSITLDGVTYNLNAVTTSEDTITVSQDTDAVYSLVRNFVDAYNTLISTINDQLDETYDRSYPPLTSAQEAEMTSTEISAWDEKAKKGLLQRDSLLTNMLSSLRYALQDSVSGSSLSLSDIGITTGTYTEKGKLYIDEDALKSAIEDDSSSVQKLFAQKSTSYPTNSTVRTLNSSQRSTRYKEEGIALRFNDVLETYVDTGVDSAGNKGFLLEKAGITSDSSSSDNTFSKQIDTYETRISKEEDRLSRERARLEAQYTAMEQAISEMNSQSSYIASLTSSSN